MNHNEKRDETLYIRVTKQEKSKMQKAARQSNYTNLSEFIRKVVFDFVDKHERNLNNEK